MSKGLVSHGVNLVLRHLRVLFWIFLVNLLLGVMAALAPRALFGGILNTSAYSRTLVDGFNLAAFFGLLMRPEVTMLPLIVSSTALAFVFFVYMLIVMGGVLSCYREDRHLSTPEFFEAGGRYFWRFTRLSLMALVPFGLLSIAWGIVSGISGKMSSDAAAEKLGFYVQSTGGAVLLIVALLVRLWFDVAQVRAVAQEERGMFRNLMRTFSVTRRSLGTLLWMYLRISLLAWATLAAAIYCWMKLPGSTFILTMLILEGMLFTQLFARLWQKASCISWYQQYAVEHLAIQVEMTTPEPVEIVEPKPETVPERDGSGM